MTKIRQYVSFVMAVIIMNSAFNPYSVYADELPSESEIEQSETEQPTEIESVTKAEFELESETASGADTELENDGIYNDAEYIDDLMINDIAVYSNSRPTGGGRETGGTLRDGSGRPVGRTGGGHTSSNFAAASSSTEKFLKDIRDDIDNLADLVDGIGLKLVAINNNLCDAIGYLWDISMAVERVSSSVSTCANWLAKSKDVLDDILSNILQGNILTASINVDVGNINRSLTSYLTSFDSLISNGFKDVSGTWISNRVYYIFQDLSVIKTTVSSINNFLSVTLVSTLRSLRTELKSYLVDADNTTLAGSVRDIRLVLRTIKTYLIDAEDVSLAESIRDIRKVFRTVKDSVNNIYNQVEKLKTNFTSALSADGKWFTTIFINKLDELISAVKSFSPSIVINNFIDNSDRTKSDDEDENASLFDLIKMIMYSVFILGSLLDLLLLLLEYVVLMFQIPAVPALMNENVLLGWNYANAICIPGTQFSIISFLRLLMYITVIFSAIKVIKRAIDNGSIGVI